jgi:5-(aminomethyl)-3-furanmethanol phosphate kinase
MSLSAVLKVGGSLGRAAGLESLCGEISRLGRSHRLLVVPGGGEFADQVRAVYRRYQLDETTVHWMALLAMDQYGYLLKSLIPGSVLVEDMDAVFQAAESGRVPVLLPSKLVIRIDPLPHSWQVTSDSIAAWISHYGNCCRLVLLKDVDGLSTVEQAGNSQRKIISELAVEQLAKHVGGVDEYLASYLAGSQLETWVINGLNPERLSALLETGHAMGTRISGKVSKKNRIA